MDARDPLGSSYLGRVSSILAFVLWLSLAVPREASALHPPPAFVARPDNPFGLADVGANSTPRFADLDGDGDLDAFVGTLAGDTKFFENTGTVISPAFASATDNPFGLSNVNPLSNLSFGDLNGDGDLDVLLGESLGRKLYFSNTGTATAPAFAAVVTNPFGLGAAGTLNNVLTFADLDGDGDLDVFAGIKYDGNTQFFENTGTKTNPSFAAPVDNPFGLVGVGEYGAPSFVDLDGDGDLDGYVGEENGNTKFFENTGTKISPAFAAPVDNPFGLADIGDLSTPTFADLDGDGDLDAFIGAADGNTKFFENTRASASPNFAAGVVNAFGLFTGQCCIKPSFADLDGDGDLDIFLGLEIGRIWLAENTGTATGPLFASFQENPFNLVDVGVRSAPSFADLDGDGDLDAYIGEEDGSTSFFENTGTALAPAFATVVENPFGIGDVGDRSTPSFADVDGDGDLDAFIGADDGNTNFFENTGTATSPAFAAVTVNPFGLADVGSISAPSFADLDGDGDLDAFVGEYGGDTRFFENTGTAISPAFAVAVDNPFGLVAVPYWCAPSFADIDGDGDLDAYVGAYGISTFFENTTPVPVELMAFEIE